MSSIRTIRQNQRLVSSVLKSVSRPCLANTVSKAILSNGMTIAKSSSSSANAATTTINIMNGVKFFSTSSVTNQLSKETQEALFNKLNSEYDLEQESPVKISEEDEAFLNKSGFKLEHKVGEKIVQLEKTLSNGQILKIYFDCTELNDIHANANEAMESTMEQEQHEQEELEEQEDGFNDSDSPLENSLLNVNLILENPKTNESFVAHSYLSYEDLEFFPQSFQIIKDNQLANSLDAQSQQLKLAKYNGPGFQMLDEELQELFEVFFAEIGCTEELGEFIVNYSTVVENDEYISWLNDFKTFFK